MLVQKHVCIHACICIGSDNTFAHAADYTQHDGIHAYVAENEATVHYVHACKNMHLIPVSHNPLLFEPIKNCSISS